MEKVPQPGGDKDLLKEKHEIIRSEKNWE